MIRSFHGDFRFLSNFFGVRVVLDGVEYPTVEHAYQAAKTLDPEERQLIQVVPLANAAKRLGQKLTRRRDWNKIRVSVMRDLLTQKFSPSHMYWGAILYERLLATRPQPLVEGNTWHDQFWGDCECGRPACAAPGENWLGKLLMEVRDGTK